MADVEEAANFFGSAILDENVDYLVSDDRSDRSSINSLSTDSIVNLKKLENVRYTHIVEGCRGCEEKLCYLDFFKGLKDSFRAQNPNPGRKPGPNPGRNPGANPGLRIILEYESRYIWDGKGKRQSLFGEEMLESKVRR